MRQENIIILLYKGGSEIKILNGCLQRKAKLEFQQRRRIQVNSILAATGSNRSKDNLMWTGNWEPKSSSSHWNLPLLPCRGFTCWTHAHAHFAATCYFVSVMEGKSFLFMTCNTIFQSLSARGMESWRKLEHHPAQSHGPSSTSIPLPGQSCMEQAKLCITRGSVCRAPHRTTQFKMCQFSKSPLFNQESTWIDSTLLALLAHRSCKAEWQARSLPHAKERCCIIPILTLIFNLFASCKKKKKNSDGYVDSERLLEVVLWVLSKEDKFEKETIFWKRKKKTEVRYNKCLGFFFKPFLKFVIKL